MDTPFWRETNSPHFPLNGMNFNRFTSFVSLYLVFAFMKYSSYHASEKVNKKKK